jgi:hypothetical protein
MAGQKLAAALIILALFGCSSHTPSAAATGSGATDNGSAASAGLPSTTSSTTSSAPSSSSIDLSASFQDETIADPTLRMTAYDVKIPAGFQFQGMFVAGSSCQANPFPVVRSYSPDGLEEFRMLPRMDWSWNNTGFAPAAGNNCLNMNQELTASEFIKYLVGVLQVAYVSDEGAPSQLASLQQSLAATNAANRGKQVTTADMDAALVQYKNGTFTIQEQIAVTTLCSKNTMAIGAKTVMTENCSAWPTLTRAPQGQLTALVNAIQAQKGGANPNPQWSQAYMQEMVNKAAAQSQAIMEAKQAEFNQAQAIRAQEHQQFMAQMQAGTDASMARAAQIADTDHAIAQDWCDFSLGQQTVAGGGGTAKVSAAYTQTWSNGSQYYQTNNPNVNPGPGWSLQTKVHGDGTPY